MRTGRLRTLVRTMVVLGLIAVVVGWLGGRDSELSGYGSAINTGDEMTLENLNLKLKLERTDSHPEQKGIWIRVTLQNGGDQGLWVNKRMVWNNPNAAKAFREVWLTVESPNKKKLEHRCKIRIGFAKETDYEVLAPQAVISKDLHLSRCYDIAGKETYRVQAFYQDGNAEPPPAPANSRYVSQLIESEVIEVPGV